MGGAVCVRREPKSPTEGRGERPDAAKPDGEADLRHAAVSVAQELRRALEATGQQVLVRCLAEGPAELATEMGGREVRGTGELRYVERCVVTRVDEVLRAEEVPDWMGWRHRPEYRVETFDGSDFVL
jgi:hypothetical protein